MKITVGIQKARIETDNPKLLKALQTLYSFKVPGAAYTAAYRRRSWDGKKRFISNNGTFRSGLLLKILGSLQKIDCIPDVEFTPPRRDIVKLKQFSNIKYYDYQKDLIQKSILLKRGVIKAPTGSGKTLVMAGLVKSLREKENGYSF